MILQNVHLVAKWLPTLEKKMEEASASAHEAYRIYISAEPAPSPESHILPQGILENSIKITNEPPTGEIKFTIIDGKVWNKLRLSKTETMVSQYFLDQVLCS